MKTLTFDEQICRRGSFLEKLPSLLGMEKKALQERLSEEWFLSYEAIRRQAERKRVAATVSGDMFYNGIKNVVEEYIDDLSVAEKKRQIVEQNWNQHKEFILSFLTLLRADPESPFFFSNVMKDLESEFEKKLNDIKSVFMSLSPTTAYKTKMNYDLYKSVTDDDIFFVRAITQMTAEQKETLWDYLVEKDSPT